MSHRSHCAVITLILAFFIISHAVMAGSSVSIDKSTTVASLSMVSENSNNSSLTFRLSDANMTTNIDELGRFERLDIDGEPNTALEGWPELPMVTKLVLIPPRGGVSVDIKHVESRVEQNRQSFIVPAQDGSENLNLSGNEAIEYQEYDGFWPSEVVTVGEPAILRGYRLVKVTVHPVQYNRSTGEMKFNSDIDFDLVYGGEGVNELTNPDRVRPSSSIAKILESLVVNPPRRDNYDSPERGSYLLIYPDVNGVAEALAPLIEWRARQGWDVRIEEVQNRASYNSVKNIIQDAYDEWDNPPEMVTLVGDGDGTIGIGASSIGGNAYSDLDFVRLDGNDILADADIGRLSVDGVNQLESVVEKLVNYEAEPYMEETDWYTSGMVCAGNQISGLSTILVNRWVARELTDRGFPAEDVHEWYFNDAYENQSVSAFFQSEYRRGIAFSNYRGWIGIENTSPQSVMQYNDRNGMFPASIILTCGSGNWYGGGTLGMNEAMFRSRGGGIGGVGLQTSATHVQYNNAVSVGVWVGFLKEELYTFGTAINRGRYELYRQYDGHDNISLNFHHWTQFIGDPATHVWTGVPQPIIVEHNATLSVGANLVTVNVAWEEEERAYERALVCLYKADDDFQMLAYTDGNGVVEFALPADELSEGELMVTVTDHNVIPYLGSVDIAEHEYYLGVSGWIVEEDDDDNGEPNPGETIDLTVALYNFGSDVPEGEVTLNCEVIGQWAQVVGDAVVLDEAPETGESIDFALTVEVDASAPDGELVLVAIDAVIGEATYGSVVPLVVSAPKISIEALYFEDELEPGSIVELDVEISNTGNYDLSDFNATLWSESSVVTVVEQQALYNRLRASEADRVAGDMFRIRAHPLTVPGMQIDLKLAIESEDGFADTTTYSFNIGQSGEGDPFGPDEYGYVCFDSGDEGWEITPVYEWIEIDPDEDNNDFDGENTELRDTAEDADESVVVDLPFEFKYYGEVFNRITICTNGWAAFGNYERLYDFRNRRIASGGGPNAQLCVFWDNLTTGRIFTYADDDNGRFIVEWNDMRRLWGGQDETFQLILYDQEAAPTYTGDGLIVYQYKEVHNTSGNENQGNDTPFATVGIGNLDDTDGLEYTYWNDYHAGATELHDEMAIKFSTATSFITGVLTGVVTDTETHSPIEGAQVYTSRGFWAETNADGIYITDEILVGDSYIVTASAQGYNDSTKADGGAGYVITEAETTFVNFDLLHPEFNLDIAEFDEYLVFDSLEHLEMVLSNDGNGPLDFTSRYVYIFDDEDDRGSTNDRGRIERDESDEIWDQLLEWNATTATGCYRVQGITYVGDKWYVSGSLNSYENKFYIFDRWGAYERSIDQPEGHRLGIMDMEYYEGDLYGATRTNYITRIDPETGEELNRYSTSGDIRTTMGFTISPEGRMFATTTIGPIIEFQVYDDSTLINIAEFDPVDPRNNGDIHIYGLTWFRDDPDGYNLYVYGTFPSEDETTIALYKVDVETEDVIYLTDFNFPNEDSHEGKGGISITPKWNNLVFVLAATINNRESGDIAAIYELAPNSSWIDYSPREGHLDSGDGVNIELSLDATDIDSGKYGVMIEFTHNAYDGVTYVPIDIEIGSWLNVPDAAVLPAEYSLQQNYPNPFNPTTSIEYSLRYAGHTTLRLYDALGREVATLVNSPLAAGRYHVNIDGASLATGVYFYRLESGDFVSIRKMLLMK